jgi:hypothetical protein
MVKICAVPAELEKVTLLNSASPRLAPAKVIVPPVAESNITVPVPALQIALSVEALFHVPETVHVSLPKEMADATDEMLTFPEIVTLPEVDVRSPPDIVRVPVTVSVKVDFARVPPDSVRVPAVSWPPWVLVPPDISRVAKECPAAKITDPVPENVTLEPVEVNEVADDVSQFPVPIVIVADPNVMVAAPDDVRLLAPKDTVALVKVSIPDQVRDTPNVVLIPEFTVISFAVSSIETVPPETLTTTKEVPTVYVPPVESKLVTVIVDPFAVRIPPAAMVTVGAVIARLPPDVSSAVVDPPSLIVRVPATCIPRVAMVNVCAVPPELEKVTLLNSASPRLDPAKVIVPPVAESNVTVPVPASQIAASVEALVHVPETVHDSLPKAIADAADEIFTLPVTVTLPDVLVRSPPDRVRLPTVNVNVALANVPPETVRALVTTVFVASVTVPAEIVSALNVLSVDRRVIVAVALKVYVLVVPSLKTDPAPLVSQFPETVHAPVVTVIVPFVPPVIVTLDTVTVEAFAVRIPPFPTLSPPVLSPRSAVASSVVEDASLIASVPPQRSPRVAMVNTCAVPADELKVMLLNSASPRLVPAKVIVPPVAESKTTLPVPASHDAEVVALVHAPLMVHVSLPRSI